MSTQTQTAHSILIPADHVQLEGDLVIPEHAHGLVIFAHGSGSSRFSSRNRFVAQPRHTLVAGFVVPSSSVARIDLQDLVAR